MGDILEVPVALVIIAAAVVAVLAGRMMLRWRREAAVRDHAGRREWRPVDDSSRIGDQVVNAFPEMRDEAAKKARAQRHGAAAQGGTSRGPTLELGTSSGRSRIRVRNAYLVPVAEGELAVGDVAVSARSGTVAGRLGGVRSATIHRGAAVARLPCQLPPLKLTSRSWFRIGARDDAVPGDLADEFAVQELEAAGRAVYVDSEAWRPLLDQAADLDGVVVDGDMLVLISNKRLTPERAEALVTAAEQFAAAAVPAAEQDETQPRLSIP